MAIHVVIKRKFQINQPEKLKPLLRELSIGAQAQPGYISSETLQSVENPDECMVISKWETTDDWERWFTCKERRDIQNQVDSLIGERTFYEVFQPLS